MGIRGYDYTRITQSNKQFNTIREKVNFFVFDILNNLEVVI